MNKLVRSRPYYKGVDREYMSPFQLTGKLRYEPGTTVEADGLDKDPNKDCGKGINFCSTLAQALKWGPVVVELTVPDGEKIIDAGDKLRAKRVRVEAVADLSYSDLRGAYLSRVDLSYSNLWGSNLSYSNLYGANLSGATVNSNTIISLPPGWEIVEGVIRSSNEPA